MEEFILGSRLKPAAVHAKDSYTKTSPSEKPPTPETTGKPFGDRRKILLLPLLPLLPSPPASLPPLAPSLPSLGPVPGALGHLYALGPPPHQHGANLLLVP